MLSVNGKGCSTVANWDYDYFQVGVHLKNMGTEPAKTTTRNKGKGQVQLVVVLNMRHVYVKNPLILEGF